MIEISNRFCLLTPSSTRRALLLGHSVVPDTNAAQFSATNPITFDQTNADTDSGISWSQTFRAVTADSRILDYKDAKLYPAFYMSDGTLRVIGTHDSVPTISVTPYNGSRYLVQTSFQAPEPLTL